jgi:AcrR family transcriptional regulator
MAKVGKEPGSKPRREEILEHATRLFAERGYEGTSMGDLAALVGVRKASLFYHFASKDDLYAVSLERLVAAVSEALVTAANARGSFRERLDTMSDAVITVLGEQPFAARVLLREAMDFGPVMRNTLIEPILGALGTAERFFVAGQAAGEFGRFDVRQMLVTMIGVYFMPFGIGGVVERYTGEQPFAASFIRARKEAVRAQVRRLVLANGEN